MIIAPLALLALIRGKRRAGKIDQLLVLLIVVVAVGLTITGCNPPPPPQPPTKTTQPTTPTRTNTPEPTPTQTKSPASTETPTPAPTETLKPPEKCGQDSEIDNQPEGLGYYGKKIYALYKGMEKAKDAWWYKLNNNVFTWEQFNGLLLMHEGAGTDIKADLVALAAAQNLFIGGYNPPYCSDQCNCFIGVFRFWAAYSQSIRSLGETYENQAIAYRGYGNFADLELLQKQPGVVANYMMKAHKLGNEMLHPENLLGDKNTGPSNWGNVEDMWTDALKMKGFPEGKVISIDDDKVYYYNDSFVVYSVNQKIYWEMQLGRPIKLEE